MGKKTRHSKFNPPTKFQGQAANEPTTAKRKKKKPEKNKNMCSINNPHPSVEVDYNFKKYRQSIKENS